MNAPIQPGAGFEPAGEVKIGQVGIANLRVRTLDVARLAQEMRERIARAPRLFERAAFIIDFGALPEVPDVAAASALMDALREAGVLPVALAWGSRDNERLAHALGLPVVAKFRARIEQPDAAPNAAPAAASAPTPAGPLRAADGDVHARRPLTLVRSVPVRSGQQVYAEGGDLTVLAGVGAGAEVLADGCIHIYGPLRGRALAGADGNLDARIFCHSFQAELVAIAGHYMMWDDVPAEFHGKPVHLRLEHEALKIELLQHD